MRKALLYCIGGAAVIVVGIIGVSHFRNEDIQWMKTHTVNVGCCQITPVLAGPYEKQWKDGQRMIYEINISWNSTDPNKVFPDLRRALEEVNKMEHQIYSVKVLIPPYSVAME